MSAFPAMLLPALPSALAEGIDARQLIYLISLFVASMLFILGLRGLSHADTARRGMQMAAVGMFVAVVGTLLHERIVSYEWIVGGLVVGTVIGIPMGLWIPMTKICLLYTSPSPRDS